MFRGYIDSMYSNFLFRIDNVEELIQGLRGRGFNVINIQQRPIWRQDSYHPLSPYDTYTPNIQTGMAITMEYMDTRGFRNSKTFLIGDTILFTANDFCILDDRNFKIKEERHKRTLIMDTE